jgi:mono/diheme cytochrome c family protein
MLVLLGHRAEGRGDAVELFYVIRSKAAMKCGAVFVCLLAGAVHAATLEQDFDKTVKPFVASYCSGCHGGKTPVAQFNMQQYGSMASVVDDIGHWNLVLERVAAKQMPPKGGKQPSDAERQALVDWIRSVRTTEAKKNAGDPGRVLARRLSNAEYNYTIRDLTGVDIRPTKEFPVDPANPAGFDNSGESLNMSPALLNKYLQAAREVGNHMALTPDGITFAPHPMLVETDKEKFAIQRIVDFYLRQPTDYSEYFLAAWRYKNRAALGKPRMTLASAAGEAKLSAKYLPMVWRILGETKDPAIVEAGPVAKLRTMCCAPCGARCRLRRRKPTFGRSARRCAITWFGCARSRRWSLRRR